MKKVLCAFFLVFFSVASFGGDVTLGEKVACQYDWCGDWRSAYITDNDSGGKFATVDSDNSKTAKSGYVLYVHDNKCCGIKCKNNRSFFSQDSYSCSMCQENGGNMGYAATGDPNIAKGDPCYWCDYGKCYNKKTYKCEPCSFTASKARMQDCLLVVDADEFKKCVTGVSTSN